MREEGIEPSKALSHMALNHARLTAPTLPQYMIYTNYYQNIYKFAYYDLGMVKRTEETRNNPSWDDILQKLRELGTEALQSEYLENVLKKMGLVADLRIMVNEKLAMIHAKRGLYTHAASLLKEAAELSKSLVRKKELFLQEGIYHISAFEYAFAQYAFEKAVEAAPQTDKEKLKRQVKENFIKAAEGLEKERKISRAAELYDWIIRKSDKTENLSEVKMKLSVLYEKLGKIQESISLRNQVRAGN